jgi:hypothetical protein
MDWKSKESWLDSCKGQQILLLSKASRPALKPHGEEGGGGVEQPGQEAEENRDFHPMPKLTMREALPPLHHMPSSCAQGQLYSTKITKETFSIHPDHIQIKSLSFCILKNYHNFNNHI